MANTSVSTDETFKYIRIHIICRYLYLIIFSIGIIGNIFNLIIFFRKKFRKNSCSIYFISYSINNFLNLTIGLGLWSFTLGFDFDLEYRSLTYCKIRRYCTHVNFLLSSFLLTMASINRYARVRQANLTENHHRYISFCKHHTTYLIIISTIVFCLIINIHIPLFFQIRHKECYAHGKIYRVLFDIYYLLFYTILPPLIMIGINIATIKHIRRIKKLVHRNISRSEYNFIILVLVHSFSNLILSLPYTIMKFIYYTLEDSMKTEKHELINSIALLIAFMNPALSFFLYTLTTKSFRQEFIQIWKDLLGKINFCQQRLNNQNQKSHTAPSTISLSAIVFTITRTK